EDCGEDVIWSAVARLGRRAEGLALSSDASGSRILGQEFLAIDRVYLHLRKDHVAARPGEIAEERVETGNGAAGLRRIGVLAKPVPHVHTDRTVVRQEQCGLPNFISLHGMNFFRSLGCKRRGDFTETLKNRLADDFIAVLCFERMHPEKTR